MNGIEQRIELRTPEGIAFSYSLAGVIVRFLARAVDLAIIGLIFYIGGSLARLSGLALGSIGSALAMVFFFLVQFGYAIALEWFWNGKTVGKYLLRLQVIDVHGMRLQFGQVVIRNLMRVIDVLPAFYLAGGIAAFFSKNAQRLGDLAANTTVIRKSVSNLPDWQPILEDRENSFRAWPRLCARLRQVVTPDEAHIALRALARRDTLEPDARARLFEELARYFQSLVSFPEDALLGLSPEQVVRNVVDILYRSGRTVEKIS